VPWPGSPLRDLFPAAYATPGLLAAQLVTLVLTAASLPLNSLMIGGGRHRELVLGQAVTTAGTVLASATVLVLGAFASPFSSFVTLVLSVATSLFYLGRMYRSSRSSSDPADGASADRPDQPVLGARPGPVVNGAPGA